MKRFWLAILIVLSLVTLSYSSNPITLASYWMSLTNVEVISGTTINKNAGGAAWNADVVSIPFIASDVVGSGVSFKCSQTNAYAMIGLSADDPDADYTTIDFGIDCLINGTLSIYENGTLKSSGTTYTTSDVLSLVLNSGSPKRIEYKKNGTTFYTSLNNPSYPLFVDASIYTQGGGFNSVTLIGASAGNTVRKNTDGDSWNFSVLSNESIATDVAGYGVSFKCSQPNAYAMLGLSADNPNADYTTIDFGIDCLINGTLNIYENGTLKSSGTTYTTSDVLSLVLNSGSPKRIEYKKNGTTFYTSLNNPSYPLFVDASIYTQGGGFNSIELGLLVQFASKLPDDIIISSDTVNQTYYYFQKGTSLSSIGILNSNEGVGGVKFTLDGVTTLSDTNVSDLNYSADFSSYMTTGKHTMRFAILDVALNEKIVITKTFFIVDEIWGFYGDSMVAGYYSDSISVGLSNVDSVFTSINTTSGGTEGEGGRQSKNSLIFEQHDPYNGLYYPGAPISFSTYSQLGGKTVFILNEAKSSEASYELLSRWTGGVNDRCISVDGISGNASLRGITHSWIMHGLNDKQDSRTDTQFEADLGTVVQNLINCNVPASNIYVSYPTYSTVINATSYHDNVDNVIINKGIKAGPNFYDYIYDNQQDLDSAGTHVHWLGYYKMGQTLHRFITGKDYWGDGYSDSRWSDWLGSGSEDYGNIGAAYLSTGATFDSPVYDLFSNKNISLTVSESMVSGSISKYTRCSNTEFTQSAGSPSWNAYTVPHAYMGVRWCQIRLLN